jgi:basic membrane protein A
MKKFLALALASVMAVSLVACGSTNADTNAESSAAATESGSEEPGLKIAIVSSPSGVDDGSFNQDNYNGVLKFIEENPNATVTPIREETGDSAAAVQAVADVVADYDVIVCCGFQSAAHAGSGTAAGTGESGYQVHPDRFLAYH